MAFAWRDFHAFAEDLYTSWVQVEDFVADASGEATCRTIAGRVYYAIFQASKAYVRGDCEVPVRRDTTSHDDVISALKDHAKASERERELGELLHQLQGRRSRADYTEASILRPDRFAEGSLDNGDAAWEILDDLKSRAVVPFSKRKD